MIHTGGQTGPRWRASLGKSGPKIPVFAFSFAHLFMLSRACSFRASIGKTRGNGGILTFSFSVRRPCERREERERESGPSLRQPLSVCVKVERDSNAILDNGKLEDLVRLALKRLNVSYLTILSRLVWFQRETLVCHEHERKETFATCFLEFCAIKFYSISLYRMLTLY